MGNTESSNLNYKFKFKTRVDLGYTIKYDGSEGHYISRLMNYSYVESFDRWNAYTDNSKLNVQLLIPKGTEFVITDIYVDRYQPYLRGEEIRIHPVAKITSSPNKELVGLEADTYKIFSTYYLSPNVDDLLKVIDMSKDSLDKLFSLMRKLYEEEVKKSGWA